MTVVTIEEGRWFNSSRLVALCPDISAGDVMIGEHYLLSYRVSCQFFFSVSQCMTYQAGQVTATVLC